MERTFSIIKPDAVERNLIGAILGLIEKNNLRIIATKKVRLTPEQARQFYAVHKDRPFFDELVEYMCSGPCVVSVLEGENAIENYRTLMGATNYKEAAKGTIRNLYGQSLTANSVHGSDAPETAAVEIAHFFSALEITG